MSVFAYIKQHSAWSSYDEVFDSNLISSKNLTKLFKLYIYLYLDIDSEEISITRTSGVAEIKELFEENLCWITKRLTRIFFFRMPGNRKKKMRAFCQHPRTKPIYSASIIWMTKLLYCDWLRVGYTILTIIQVLFSFNNSLSGWRKLAILDYISHDI